MPKFKRLMSFVLVFAMLMSSVSCLGGVFTIGAAAEDAAPTYGLYNDGDILTKSEIQTKYATEIGASTFGWAYYTSDILEVPTDGSADADTVVNSSGADAAAYMTDGYVSAGQTLIIRNYLACSDSIYMNIPPIGFSIDKSLFTATTVDEPLLTQNDTLASKGVCMNLDHSMYDEHGANWQYTLNMGLDWSTRANQTKTGLEMARTATYWICLFTCSFDGWWQSDGQDWIGAHAIKVLDTAAEGDTGSIWVDRGANRAVDGATSTGDWFKTTAKASAPWNIPARAASDIEGGNTADAGTADYMHKTGLVVITSDFGGDFIVGTNPNAGGGGEVGGTGHSAIFVTEFDAETPANSTVFEQVDGIAEGATFNAPTNTPTKDGYVFNGWALATTIKPTVFPATMGSQTLYFEPLWKYDTSTISNSFGWAYYTADVLEVPVGSEADADTIVNLSGADAAAYMTDGYVSAGQTLIIRNYLACSDSIYMNIPPIGFSIDKSLFTATTVDEPLLTQNDTLASKGVCMNLDHSMYDEHGANWQYTLNMGLDWSTRANQTKTGLEMARTATYWICLFTCSFDGWWQSDGQDWIGAHAIKVLDTAAEGDTGSIWVDRGANRAVDGATSTGDWFKTTAKASAPWNVPARAASAIEGGNTTDAGTADYMQKTGLVVITSDFWFEFVIGDAPTGWDDPVAGETYTVKFYDSDKSTVLKTESLASGTTATPPTVTVPAGMEFKGWSTDGTEDNIVDPIPAVSGNADYYAVYAPKTITVSFVVNGNTTTATYTYGSGTIADPGISVTGYSITWKDASDATVTFPAAIPAEDVTYTATLVPNKYVATYYDTDGVNVLGTMEFDYGSAITALTPPPTAEGKTLKGWATAPNSTTTISNFGTMTENGAKFYAVWSTDTYTITWIIDGKTTTEDYAFGATITAPEATKTGYSFNGWDSTVPSTMPAENLTFTAQFTVNSYVATFYADTEGDDVFFSDSFDYGTAIQAPENAPSKYGYEFDGWTPAVGTMPVDGAEFRPIWKPKYFPVTFIVDGETVSSSSVAFGAQFDDVEAEEKQGYTFAGWSTVEDDVNSIVTWPQTLTTEGAIFYAVYTQGTASYVVETYEMDTTGAYKLISNPTIGSTTGAQVNATPTSVAEGFYLDTAHDGYLAEGTVAADGSLVLKIYIGRNVWNLTTTVDGETETAQVYYGATLTVSNPVKYGHQFDGWVPALPATMPNNDVVTEASFSEADYIVTFVSDTGTETKTVNFNDEYDAVADPDKPGSNFLGWSTDGTEANIVTWPQTLTTEGANFTAVFSENTYTVTVYLFEGDTEPYKTYTGKYGETIYYDGQNPTDVAYNFKGWNPSFPITITEEKNYEVYGTWDPKNFYIEFYDYNGNIIENAGGSYAYGTDTATIAPEPGVGPANTSFVGWFGINDDLSVNLNDPMPATVPAVAYQAYRAYFSAQTYTITFMNGDAVVDEVLATQGSTVTAPDAPAAADGYEFLGWSTDDTAANIVETIVATGNETYYAVYGEKTYNVNYYVNDVKVHTEPVKFGATIPEYVYSETGYDFNGWDTEIPGTMPAGDLDIYGTATAQIFTITFIVNGESKTEEFAFGASLADVPDAELEGHTFTGWNPALPETMPAENLTVEAVFEAKQITVTFVGEGMEPVTYTEAFGTVLTAPDFSKTGYDFLGWTPEVPATYPAEDTTYTASYAVKSFTITYMANGEVYDTDTYEFGKVIDAIDAPTLEGHDFSGWTPALPATMPAEDLTVEAVFVPKQITVTFVGEGMEPVTYTEAFGTVLTAPDFSKTGYDFIGWTPEVPATYPAEDTTYVAGYSAHVHKVYFVVDGETIDEQDVAFGTMPELPTEPSKPGYSFAGWDPEVTAQPDNDVTYTATWTESGDTPYTVNTYTMDTEGNYGEPVTVTKYGVTNGAVDADAAAPATGFYYDTEHEGYLADGTIAADGSSEFNVYIARSQYTITFAGGDGGNVDVTDYYGAAVEVPTLTKEGYSWVGWDATVPETMPANNMTISALFTINNYTITYKYDGKTSTSKYRFGDEVTIPGDPSKTGYEFVGWIWTYVDAAGETQTTTAPATMPAYDLVAEADFDVLSYKFTYIVDGVPTEKMYEYGQKIDVPADPEKPGHSFSRWQPAIPETMPAYDLTVTAMWNTGTFIFTYIVDGKSTSIEYAYGASIAVPGTPSKTGYTFTGWLPEIPSTMPSEDLTVEAQFQINTHTFTYIVDGVPTDKDYEYGKEITVPETPTKVGYTFAYWNPTIPTAMPDNDVTVEAVWNINVHKVTFTIDGVDQDVDTKYGEVPEAPPAEKEGYNFDGWYVTGDETMTIVEIDAIGDAPEAYTAKFSIKTLNAIFDANGGKFASGATIPVPTVYGAKIAVPEEVPVREGYNFAGYAPVPDTMGAEDTVYYAQWTQDLSFCRIQSVERTTAIYGPELATYEVKVVGEPVVKVQFAFNGDADFNWTFDREPEEFAQAGTAGLVSITEYNAGTADAYEIWTINAIFGAGEYKVRAKRDFTEDTWEEMNFGYDYTVTYDTATESPADLITSASIDVNKVLRGQEVTFTVVADEYVTLIQITDSNTGNSVAYGAKNAESITDNGDGTNTWVFKMRATYVVYDADSETQIWNFAYCGATDVAFTESEVAALTLVVDRYDDTAADENAPYTIKSASAVAGKKASYTNITVVTTDDVSKIRFTIGTKTVTYTTSSKNVSAVTANGETTWTIGYRFAASGTYNVGIQCRGNAWSDATNVAVTIYNTQAEADAANGVA